MFLREKKQPQNVKEINFAAAKLHNLLMSGVRNRRFDWQLQQLAH